MPAVYLGTLDRTDPLYEVLASCARRGPRPPVFHVDRLSPHHLVFRYSEEATGEAMVGKFFRVNEPDEEKRARLLGEYRNLLHLRALGFIASPFTVVRPLCREERIGLAVAEEFVAGKDLDHFLRKAVGPGDSTRLRRVLTRLAAFLEALHDRTVQPDPAPLDVPAAYFQRIARTLTRQGVLDADGAAAALRLRDRWLSSPSMTAYAVTVHGDATPTNFLFPEDGSVVAIDLERMTRADRVYDIGMVCGELKHAFLWRTGNPFASEPYIRHFLDRYARFSAAPERVFREVTRRLPFYMGLTELRIARNGWLDADYRRRLAREALACLTWGLRQ